MTRPEITDWLTNMLINQRLSEIGKYYATEVTLDYVSAHPLRIDVLEFCPVNTTVSGIEKGTFCAYEVKSCTEDLHSGHGRNVDETEKAYYVMPMSVYKENIDELFSEFYTGVIVPIPWGRDINDEFENPSKLDADKNWTLKVIKPSHPKNRHRSMTELLFCMLRAGH